MLSRNDVLLEVLSRTAAMGLPGWYLTAGCLFQTVWNVVTDQPPTSGIKDYDVFYFDDSDLSWEAEDAVIRAGQETFRGLPAQVEIRNEARVHLWYEQRFGVACDPHTSTESAIDCFAATTCCVGVRLEPDGRWRVYAPQVWLMCSIWSCVLIRCLPRRRSTRPRRPAGGSNGPNSLCWTGRQSRHPLRARHPDLRNGTSNSSPPSPIAAPWGTGHTRRSVGTDR